MNYIELLKYKPLLMKIFEQYGVTHPRIFGSVVRGVAGPKSDIDFLISWPVKHSLIDRIDLKNKLESILHTKVDLVTDQSLHHLVREKVLQEAKDL